MNCKGVFLTLYDYEKQSEEELDLKENDLLLVLDDSDPDWYRCLKVTANTLEDNAQGLVPSNYIEKESNLPIMFAAYDYQQQNDQELTISENEPIHVVFQDDSDWILGFQMDKKLVGYVPANYLESQKLEPTTENHPQENGTPEPSSVMSDSISVAKADQKMKLMSALEGLGPAPIYKPVAVNPELASAVHEEYAPSDVKFYPFVEYDKKKKKHGLSGLLGISNDFEILFVEASSKRIISKYQIQKVSKCSEKKGKRFHFEIEAEVYDFEGEKTDIQSLLSRFEEMKLRSKISGPIITGPPPVVLMGSDMQEQHYSDDGPSSSSHQPHADQYTELPRQPPPVIEPSPIAASMTKTKEYVNQASVKAIYDYDAQAEDELTLREGEVLNLVDSSDRDWHLVSNADGQQGLVPASYLEIVAAQPPPNLMPRPLLSSQSPNKTEINVEKQSEIRPHLMQRPNISDSVPPPLSERPKLSSQVDSIQQRGDSLSSSSSSKPTVKAAPDQTQLRTWTDRSGSFKVDAQYLGIADGKVHLHKVNGVKITVPLQKLSLADIAYLKTIPENAGYDFPSPSTSKEPQAPSISPSFNASISTPVPASTVKKADAYVYNGFDWRAWLIAVGISDSDAVQYAPKFVQEKLDKSSLPDLDRDFLKSLGIPEGDLIKIRKAIPSSASINPRKTSNDAAPVTFQRREDQTLLQNLEKITKNNLSSSFNGRSINDQISEDERLARQLQEEELRSLSATQSGSNPRKNNKNENRGPLAVPLNMNKDSFSNKGATKPRVSHVEEQSFKTAVELLSERSKVEAENAALAAAIRASSANLPSSEKDAEEIVDPFEQKLTISSSKKSDDAWTVKTVPSSKNNTESTLSNTIPSSKPVSQAYNAPTPPPLPSMSTKPVIQFNSSNTSSPYPQSVRSSVPVSSTLHQPLIPTPTVQPHSTFVPTNNLILSASNGLRPVDSTAPPVKSKTIVVGPTAQSSSTFSPATTNNMMSPATFATNSMTPSQMAMTPKPASTLVGYNHSMTPQVTGGGTPMSTLGLNSYPHSLAMTQNSMIPTPTNYSASSVNGFSGMTPNTGASTSIGFSQNVMASTPQQHVGGWTTSAISDPFKKNMNSTSMVSGTMGTTMISQPSMSLQQGGFMGMNMNNGLITGQNNASNMMGMNATTSPGYQVTRANPVMSNMGSSSVMNNMNNEDKYAALRRTDNFQSIGMNNMNMGMGTMSGQTNSMMMMNNNMNTGMNSSGGYINNMNTMTTPNNNTMMMNQNMNQMGMMNQQPNMMYNTNMIQTPMNQQGWRPYN